MIIETQVADKTIFFDDEKHRFWRMEEDKKVSLSSVTTFTGIIDKSPALIPWAVKLTREHLLQVIGEGRVVLEADVLEACKQHTIRKQQAADIGTQIHALVEKWIKKEDIQVPEDQKVQNGFDAFLKFQNEHKAKWLESEKIIYSKVNDYAGILDAVGIIDGKKVLVDFKSANGLYPENSLQTAGYQIAYEEMTGEPIDYRMIIRFGKDTGDFEVKTYEDNIADKEAFLACVTLKRRLKVL